ncbi:lysylphosphatidylglycerol synthase transmembrane domain-containing protein [Thermococcus sp. MAR1]|uniref:lysylphosphatidylglycerol synthase transmembrane domain-containing protein n=1 Tax=Thermococcus sp. MAR1 TaxID=1638263 RepID=UPI001438ECBF|nr:lysylphosphatidylglycerol synthase transmembrane domain-containing protein [Thermococcus sp. MAR1]NJE10934.1 flippase-like domain-containing protein [Thermococcus sp. MAR1]
MEWKKYSLLGVGLLIIILLLWWAGTGDVLNILKTARPDYFLLAVLAYVLAVIMWALRWRVLLKSLGIKVPMKTIVGGLFVGIFINNVTPGARGGGEPVRMYYVSKRTGEPYGHIFATIMMDRIMDVIPVVVMLLLATVHVYRLGSFTLTLTIFLLDVVFAAITLATVGILLSERRTKGILYWFYRQFGRIMPKKAMKYEERFIRAVEVDVPRFQENFKVLMRHKVAFTLSLLYSFAFWFLVLLRSYFIFISINSPIGLPDVMVVQMIGIVVGMFSVIPGGAGLIEAINSAVYVLLGIDKEIAVTATLLERLISYWAPTAIGAGVMTHFGIKVSQDRKLEAKDDKDINDESQ